MDPVELTDGELTLRCWRQDDAPAVYRACQDPDIQRWTTVPSPYAEADAVRFVREAPGKWADGTVAAFGVFDSATGELLGAQGLDIAGGAAELGCWAAPWARGRGVTERASRLVLEWAFGSLRLHRVSWRAVVGNHASRLVAARLGMCLEGVVRSGLVPHEGDEPQDGWLAGMLPGELRPAGPDGPTQALTSPRGDVSEPCLRRSLASRARAPCANAHKSGIGAVQRASQARRSVTSRPGV